jgi:hypothetical protein
MICKIKGLVWFDYLVWTTDPDQARGGLLLWWRKLNKIPFLVQTHKEATPYSTIGGHPQGTVPSAWDRNHIPMSQNELVL